ncbi:ABC transporter ATP-binding protein [Streptomyces venezuelae]|uniref:ABC transporter ATP-binding protein n=1 Tax=Streptomyces venezuelae TaxID=54571 RepID=A0A5P2CGL0_STRVZ|nr:ABC transporter ATP-binding protein [Streptomyces venezuelae]QES41367.1 ABC transporter ATP-binding protein [Streptomyces venezuelae]
MATTTTRPEQPAARDRLLGAATRYSAARCTVLALCAVAGSGAALLLPLAIGHALDAVLTGHLTGRGDTDATRWILACAALIATSALLDALDGVLTGTTNARTTAWLRGRVVRHVLGVGPRTTARFAPGDLVARLIDNAAHAGIAPATAAALLAALVTPVGAVVALALIDGWLAVAFVAGAPVLFLLLRAFVRVSSDCVARYQHVQGDIAGRLSEAIGGARTIAAAHTEDKEAARVLRTLPELSRQGHRMWRVQGRSQAQAVAVAPLLQIAVAAVAGHLVLQERISVGDLLAASRYAVLATGVGMLVGQLGGLVRARAAARRLEEVLAEPETAYGAAHLPPGGGLLELCGVRASRGGRTVLDGVDLTVPAGATVAVVGRSGAGKSLLAALAGRLADPDEGDVRLDGVPLDSLTREELRREVGYAFERPALLGGTLEGTIGFGSPRPAPERVREAARAARADPFITRLPDGYATPCAEAPLSGGEAQRLGLARAFARGGRLLILDDAMSSLDTVTEHHIAEALLRHTPHRSRLIIAHRAATAARADTVAWLHEGRIRAVGPHAELWQRAEYREVFGA